MLPMGYDKAFNKIISYSALLHIIMLIILVPQYFALGTTVSAVITEFIVTIFIIWFVRKKKIVYD